MDNKRFTDLFIKRPVLASVISLLIFLLGLRSIDMMQLREYPEMKNTVITVNTTYAGASSDTMQGYITSVVSKSVASAEGVDYLTAQSSQGLSSVTAHIRLNFDPNKAMVNVMTAVNAVAEQLPQDSEAPVITKSTGDSTALMYIGYTSPNMTNEQLTDFISRVIQPKLQTVPGVGQAQIMGPGSIAMRIWLDAKKMASYSISASDFNSALIQNNFQSVAGSTKAGFVQFNIDAKTTTNTVEQVQNLVVKNVNGALIRIKDFARVQLGPPTKDVTITANGQNAIFIGITSTPDANPLTVISAVNKVLPTLTSSFPSGFNQRVMYDATKFIRASIKEVIQTVFEATLIVIVIIFLFLGSVRTVLIPVVTIPLSLVGVCTFMLMAGFSINLLTLLAFVLAIGMVVDDAIVVLENIYRHVEEGKTPVEAALLGAREIAMPVISMSLTLAAVYAPIAFMQGLTGALFTEFAITLALSVLLSGVIALTLTPMMCSKVLKKDLGKNRFVHFLDERFAKLQVWYETRLSNILAFRPVVIVFAVIVLSCTVFFAVTTKNELAPDEDKGFVIVLLNAPQYANFDYFNKYSKQILDIYKQIPGVDATFAINGVSLGDAPDPTSGFSGVVLKPWSERTVTQEQVKNILQAKLATVPGLQTVAFGMPPLPGASGMPVQFVITTTADYSILAGVNDKMLDEARRSGLFMFVNSDLNYSQPKLNLHVDRNKAAALGINMQAIGSSLATLLSEGYVTRFVNEGQSYKVIPQLEQSARYNPDDLKNIYIKDAQGDNIPLSSLVSFTTSVQPNTLNQFQQLNSVTIQGVLNPGVTIPQALAYLQNKLQQNYPTGFSYDYDGQSRQVVQAGNSMLITFVFALIVIFLVLAAQFESFRDPLIILISVPMSLCGALLFMNLGFATMNIYTEIGLVTLIGLISKHGILITEFANKLQEEQGLSPLDAVIKAAGLRLRPILMTTAAMIFGVIPLLVAHGPGAHSRFDIGLVIATGMLIGTCFTLFVVPTMYTFLAKRHKAIN